MDDKRVIEITPSMMEAGLTVLQTYIDQDIAERASVQFAAVQEIFRAMELSRGPVRSRASDAPPRSAA